MDVTDRPLRSLARLGRQAERQRVLHQPVSVAASTIPSPIMDASHTKERT